MANEPTINIKDVDFTDFTKECYEIYGAYVNNFRSIPSIFDGLKPVQRRVIYTAMMDTSHKKTGELAAATMKHHPHGSASIEPVCNFLKRKGILDGQGNFGDTMMSGQIIKASAARYTSCWINPGYHKLFSKLIKYSPTYKGEYDLPQPHYIPTPIPLCLTLGGFGIGIGCAFASPTFTASSLLKAYLANDYTLLEPPKGYELDKNQIAELWKTHHGRVTYKLHTEPEKIEGRPGIAIVGGTEVFTPTLTDNLAHWVGEGRVFMADYTSGGVGRLAFSVAPRVSWPTYDDVVEEVNKMLSKSITYSLKASYAGTVYSIGMYDWIDITYKNYLRMFDMYKADQIQSLEHLIPIYEHFTDVANMLIQRKTDKEIIQKLKVEPWIVNEISKKTLRTMQTLNPKNKLDQIHKNIESVKAMSGDKFISDTFLDGKDVEIKLATDEETESKEG